MLLNCISQRSPGDDGDDNEGFGQANYCPRLLFSALFKPFLKTQKNSPVKDTQHKLFGAVHIKTFMRQLCNELLFLWQDWHLFM